MARAKTQLTGFSRFLIFLLIATPLIFFGVTTYKGEDPMQTLRNLIDGNIPPQEQVTERPASTPESTPAPVEEPAVSETAVNSELAKLRDENAFKEERITDLYRENEELKAELVAKEKELEEVKSQLEKIRSAIGK